MSEAKPLIGITTDVKSDLSQDESFVMETTYARAVAKAGGIPLLLPSLSADRALLENTVEKIDGLLLPGGRDMDPKFYNEEPHPKLRLMSIQRTESELILLERATKQNIPVLGICGGMQLINVFFKGTLYQDIFSLIPNALTHEKGSVHEIYVEEGTLLGEIIRKKNFAAKSYHHQSVKALGNGLRVCANSPDGVIEAIEGTDSHFMLGIQWHPEREESEISNRIFQAFLDKCRDL